MDEMDGLDEFVEKSSSSSMEDDRELQDAEYMAATAEDRVDIFDDDVLCCDNDEEIVETIEEVVGGNDEEDYIAVNSLADIGNVDFNELTANDVVKFHFPDVNVAYLFYNWYAKMNGFAARKSKVVRDKEGEIVQQTFLCFRQGYREEKYKKMKNRKREPRLETRCGCDARMRVQVGVETGRWYVTFFSDDHNHQLMGGKLTGMLAAHRQMTEDDIGQMNNMRKAGISTSEIYGSFASQSGGFHKVGFAKRDMYNQIEKQRRMQKCDVRAVVRHLREWASSDPAFYWRYEVDADGTLQQLFWCDGTSQLDYKLFGDVLAFDATYGKNRYRFPLVVFSGVNHHNQTIVFASAVVRDETEETYVWLLRQFVAAMKGKSANLEWKPPKSVITDGDLAMKNAIQTVFPESHHRLCAWHLIRNATSNVGNPRFTSMFKKCMLGDYEVGVFKRKWDAMVEEFGVQNERWVIDMYAKRKMWATAHIRGKFFAGFRTTSRCEGLHSQLGRFLHARYNLTEFILHFHRCLDYMRFREVEADFASSYGVFVMQTQLQALEKCASLVFTKEIFLLFRPMLFRAATLKVAGCKETATCSIYIVSKYLSKQWRWHVSFYPTEMLLKCSCLRMESLGIPCDHIVAVMVYLDIDKLPKCLVLDRWTKSAKQGLECRIENGSLIWDSLLMSRYAALLDSCRHMCNLACRRNEDFNDIREKVNNEISILQATSEAEMGRSDNNEQYWPHTLKDPQCVRCKGCKTRNSLRKGKRKRTQRCGICRNEGHNRMTCQFVNQRRMTTNSRDSSCASLGDDDGGEFYNYESNTDLGYCNMSDANIEDDADTGIWPSYSGSSQQ